MERSKNHKTANGTFTKNVDIYMFQVSFFLFGKFVIKLECVNLGKDILAKLSMPNISVIKRKHGPTKKL